MSKEYYLVSNEKTDGFVRTFWRPEGRGYTINLDEAGLYSLDYSKEYPLIDRSNIGERGRFDDFYIHRDDIELIGKKMACILN